MSELKEINFLNPGSDEKKEAVRHLYRVDMKNLLVRIYDEDGWERYEIDLERCGDSAQILDWIYQIKAKTWCTPNMIMAVLYAIDEAFEEAFGLGVQANICSFGRNLEVDWRRFRLKQYNFKTTGTI